MTQNLLDVVTRPYQGEIFHKVVYQRLQGVVLSSQDHKPRQAIGG